VIIDRKEDLPAPEGPIIVKNSPELTEPLRSLRISLLSNELIKLTFFHFKVIAIVDEEPKFYFSIFKKSNISKNENDSLKILLL
jgi:hypothetical protein